MNGSSDSRVRSGTPGLDDVLRGGFVPGQTTVVTGGPGTGKTLLALQFLTAGEESLYIGFEEDDGSLRKNAESVGVDLSDVEILDLSSKGERFFNENAYSIFPPDEVEGESLLETIATAIDEHEPSRLVIDPLSELRALLPDEFQFRRNISSLFNELRQRGVTTLCTTQYTEANPEADLQFLGDVTLELRRSTRHRTVEVTKFRGSDTQSGRHTYRITDGDGARVYPKLVPGDHLRETDRDQLRSGIDGLDELLGGGIERGSVTVVSGPSGVGKTTTGSQFLMTAAEQDERATAFLFEELRSDYLYRSGRIGMPMRSLAETGGLELKEVEALSLGADEFAHQVREAVETRDVRLVMLDGTAGYRLALRGDDSHDGLTRELHALCRYLKRMGVTVILIEEVRNITGEFTATNEQISYLADNIVFLRYIEIDGEIRKAIGVLKKRFGDFEGSLRELDIGADGLHVGEPLTGLGGLLTGTPGHTRG